MAQRISLLPHFYYNNHFVLKLWRDAHIVKHKCPFISLLVYHFRKRGTRSPMSLIGVDTYKNGLCACLLFLQRGRELE